MKFSSIFSIALLSSLQSLSCQQAHLKAQAAQDEVGIYTTSSNNNTLQRQDSYTDLMAAFQQKQERIKCALMGDQDVWNHIEIIKNDPIVDEKTFEKTLLQNLVDAKRVFQKNSAQRMQKSPSFWEKIFKRKEMAQEAKKFHDLEKADALRLIKSAFATAIGVQLERVKDYINDGMVEKIRIILFEQPAQLHAPKKTTHFSAIKWGGATFAVAAVVVTAVLFAWIFKNKRSLKTA